MKRRRSIWKHPVSGIFYAAVQQNGKKKNFPLGRDQREAITELAKLEKRLARGEISVGVTETTRVTREDGQRDLRIEELAHLHLEWVQHNRSPGTYALRQYYARMFLKFIGPRMVSSITRLDLEQFKAWARDQRREPASPSSDQAFRHTKTMLKWGEDNEVCSLSFRRFPPYSPAPSAVRLLTVEELRAVLAVAPEDVQDLIRFLILTGLRPQELRGLRRDDVIEQPGNTYFVRVQHPKAERQFRGHMNREIPLCREALEILRRAQSRHPRAERIFVNDDGTPYTADVLRRRLTRWGRKAGIPNLNPYQLRHLHGTMQAATCTNQSILKQIMGHTHIRTTDRYIHPTAAAHMEAVERVSSLVGQVLAAPAASPRAS